MADFTNQDNQKNDKAPKVDSLVTEEKTLINGGKEPLSSMEDLAGDLKANSLNKDEKEAASLSSSGVDNDSLLEKGDFFTSQQEENLVFQPSNIDSSFNDNSNEVSNLNSGGGDSLPLRSQKKFLPRFLSGGAVILVILIIFLTIGFSFFKKKSVGSDIEIVYWGLWEPEPVFQGVIADFQKEHPNIKVRYLQQDKQDYRARLQSALSRGEAPDIFRFHQSWLPMLANDLSPVPSAVVESLGLEKDYFPVFKETLKRDGQFYGLPLMVETLALFYNKDILSSANKTPPRTWWGLENLAKDLTVRVDEKISVAGVALGAVKNVDHWSDIIGLMIFQNGGHPAMADNMVEDALHYYLRFKTVSKVWDETLPASTLAFAEGKLVFYFGPSWRIFNILEANPKLNFAVTGVPQLPKLTQTDLKSAENGEGELTNIGWASSWVEGVWAQTKHPKEVWDFLQFLGSKETLQKLYTAQSQIRSFGEIYPRVDLASSLETDPILAPFVGQAKIAKNWYLCSFTHDAGINERMIRYYENALNSLAEGEQPEKVLETLGNGIKQVGEQYGIRF